jgi:hypothetical protein
MTSDYWRRLSSHIYVWWELKTKIRRCHVLSCNNTINALFPAVGFGASALSPPVYTIRLF